MDSSGNPTPAELKAMADAGNVGQFKILRPTYKRQLSFDTRGAHRKELQKKGKDAFLAEIVALAALAKKAGASFTEVSEALSKGYGPIQVRVRAVSTPQTPVRYELRRMEGEGTNDE